MAAVAELATVQPHVADTTRFTRESWPIYWQGYYAALGRALQVMQLARDRRTARQQAQRRQAALHFSAWRRGRKKTRKFLKENT